MREKPPCEGCAFIWNEKGEDPPCDRCRPRLFPENEDPARVWEKVQNQVIITMGEVVDINHVAVKTVMDIYNVKNQRQCFEAVLDLFYVFLEEDRLKRMSEREV